MGEQSSGDSDFRELKDDITAMSHDLRADLDELLWQRGQRSVFHFFRQRQSPLLANKRSSDHLRATSGLPPASDIPPEMSASPSGPDLPSGALVRLVMTQSRHDGARSRSIQVPR